MTARTWLALALVAALALAMTLALRHRTRAHPILAARRVQVAAFLLLVLGVAALGAPLLAPYRPWEQLDIITMANLPPSWQHPLGTDGYSRDLFSRLLFGARISLGVGALGMLVAVGLGGLVGAVAGFFGRVTDSILMRVVDVGLAVPRIFLVLAVTALWDRLGVWSLIALLGLTGWFATSRMVRAEVLVLRAALYTDAARALGAGPWRILFRHVLPNASAPLIISAVLGIGNVMLLEAALSFLGVGVRPPTPSWGNMIADGRDQLATAPWGTLFPGLAIAVVVMSLNLVGDALHQAVARPGATVPVSPRR